MEYKAFIVKHEACSIRYKAVIVRYEAATNN